MNNGILEQLKQAAVALLTERYGACGVAEGDDGKKVFINAVDEHGCTLTIDLQETSRP